MHVTNSTAVLQLDVMQFLFSVKTNFNKKCNDNTKHQS